MEDSLINDNFAASGGGGVSLGMTEALIKRTTFISNDSVRFNNARPLPLSGFGGALNIIGSKVRVEGGTIAMNQCHWGWGVFVQRNVDSPTAVDVVGTTFTDNRNISGNGSSAALEHWSATGMQSVPVTGAATFRCDDVSCVLMPST